LEPAYMPSAYGDYYGKANGRGDRDDPAFLHAISKLQYALLRAWVNGDFLADWEQVPANPPAVTPEGLDHAALDNMSGGAFFPGMEASWLFAHEVVWRSPFRVARGKNVGSVPVPDDARHDLLLEAGAFSQQMAVPWQADFLDCSSLTSDDGSEYGGWVKDDTAGGKRRRVAWWPANRPNDVFPIGAPRSRRPWARVPDARGTGGYHEVQDHNEMVAIWSTLGFIVEASPDGEQRDLFEVEFNTAPPLVAEAVVPSAQDAKRGRPRKTSGRKRKPKVRITV